MDRPGIISKLILLFLRLSAYKHKLTVRWWKNPSAYDTPPEPMFEEFQITETSFMERSVWRISPKENASGKVIFYLHGGGFHKGFMKIHWRMLSYLCKNTGYSVVAPDYPLCPDNDTVTVLNFLEDLYEDLHSRTSGEILFMGDSNGGGLCHSLCQILISKKKLLPSQLILLSPWLDLSFSNPLIEDLAQDDPLLDPDVLKIVCRDYVNGMEINDYRISPVYGNIRRIPPTTVFTGTNDITLPDCRKLKLKAESEPVVFNYREFKGMFHNWMFFNFPEGEKARSMITGQINNPPSEAEMAMNAESDFWK